jgi:sugar lactone lactonase YvrE
VTRRRAILLALLLPIGALSGYLLFWPTGLDPEAWQPPALARWPSNQALAGRQLLHPELVGAEAVAIDSTGRAVTGLADGRIVRFAPGGGDAEELAHTGGRPLGLAFDPQGRLVIADAVRGLLALDPGGAVHVLVDQHEGKPLRLVDDVVVARDGTAYFTVASDRFSLHEFKLDILEHRPRGRVLAYDPRTGAAELIADRLYFANGIALGPDEAYLVVSETSSYRVRRIWLRGDRRGEMEILVDNLPGFPDNITWSAERGVFWLAIGAPRDRTLDRLGPRPFLRRVIARLPVALQPAPVRHAYALAFDPEGALVHDLQGVGEAVPSMMTSVIEHQGQLYLGSLGRGVSRIPAP